MKKAPVVINWLLFFFSIVIVTFLTIFGVAWIPLSLYWVVNSFKGGLEVYQEQNKRIRNILITICAIIAAVLLSQEGNPWPSIFTFWIISISKIKMPYKKIVIMPAIFLAIAFLINIVIISNMNPWWPIFIYWVIAAMRNTSIVFRR